MARFNSAATLAIFVVIFFVGGSQSAKIIDKLSNLLPYTEPHHGKVYGAYQCGGNGTFYEYRFEGCNPKAPCKTFADGDHHGEIDFSADRNRKDLAFRLLVGVDPDYTYEPLFDGDVPDDGVEAGKRYTLFFIGNPGPAAAGKTMKGRFEIWDMDARDEVVMCCESFIIFT